MPTATNTNTTPTRRVALGFSAAATIAGLTAPAIAGAKSRQDAELIDLYDQFVSVITELHLLMEHDEWASDFGPNKARYKELTAEEDRLGDLIEECPLPTTPAGCAALARVALTRTPLNSDGEFMCSGFQEAMMLNLAEAVATGFVWPPRPGSFSTAHWAPPASPKEIAEHEAAWDARNASIKAEIQAKNLADAAERERRDTPSLMTEDELRGQLGFAQKFRARAEQLATEASAEMARRGLA
jgi:hypothetical protein